LKEESKVRKKERDNMKEIKDTRKEDVKKE
jgi:hypothetical protein